MPIPEKASAWEAAIAPNPDIVAAVGLCSIDVPTLTQIKERTGGTWLIGGYNPDPLTLETIASDQAQVLVGQQEYLQGYLPVAILAEHLINGTPLVIDWLELLTAVVTAENVAQFIECETDDQVQYDEYQAYIAEHFADLQAAARPYDDLRMLECRRPRCAWTWLTPASQSWNVLLAPSAWLVGRSPDHRSGDSA